jgi:(E)-2-((N-methylformamido)methylene)succinate hydrolase
VIDALGLGPVNVAGHSMGSLIAAGLAVDYPHLVSRVALLNCVHRRSPEARAAVLGRAAEIAAGGGSIEAPLARWFTPDQADLRNQVAGWLRAVSPNGYAMAYRAFAEGDTAYADRLEKIACPALVLTADGDPNSTPEMTRSMAGMMQNGHVVVIPGHRHMVNLTAPRAVTQALRDWLAIKETAR